VSEQDAAAARRAQWIEALLEERRGYEVAGKADRVAQVDAELERAGHRQPARRRAPQRTTTEQRGKG
jgi:hypothetical protein